MKQGIRPEGEALRDALRWIGERRQESPDASITALLDEAGLRFDLTPNEQEFLRATLVPQHWPP